MDPYHLLLCYCYTVQGDKMNNYTWNYILLVWIDRNWFSDHCWALTTWLEISFSDTLCHGCKQMEWENYQICIVTNLIINIFTQIPPLINYEYWNWYLSMLLSFPLPNSIKLPKIVEVVFCSLILFSTFLYANPATSDVMVTWSMWHVNDDWNAIQ